MHKINSIRLSDYFEIKRPTYIYLKLIPYSSLRNYNTEMIAKYIVNLYKAINKRIYRESKKIIIESSFTVSYIIDIKKDDTSFYFRIPEFYKQTIEEKIRSCWKDITIKESQLQEINPDSIYMLVYELEDAMSLQVDKKENTMLNNILPIISVLKNNDYVRIESEYKPMSQLGWNDRYKKTIENIKAHRSIIRNHTDKRYIAVAITNTALEIIDSIIGVFGDFIGAEKRKDDEGVFGGLIKYLTEYKEPSKATKDKKQQSVINNRLIVSSSSEQLAISTCNSYKCLDEDNTLIAKKISSRNKAEWNTMSALECTNFIQLPGKELLEQYNISCVDTTETTIPEELRSGSVCIGINTFRGNETKAYLTSDKEYGNLGLCIAAPTRAGKSTLIENISKDMVSNGECVLNFDFCGECKTSDDLSTVISEKKILNIDCSNINKLFSLDFNEVECSSNIVFEKYKGARMKSNLLVQFINSINIDNKLEPRMLRYLKAASILCFINGRNISDVFDALQDFNTRYKLVRLLTPYEKELLLDSLTALKELDDKNKQGEVLGTKTSFIQGIMNRLDIIKDNPYMELMLKQNDNKLNLVQEIQKNQLINIRIQESMFSTDTEKDVYCLFFLTKIWGALQQRMAAFQDKIKVNIILDEIYQVPLTQTFLKTKINQLAKKRCRPIISCHSLEQIKYIRPELKSANTSYMLLAGCNKDNYTELKEELYPYTLDDLLCLKRYNSLNIIKTSDGYSKFITKLPEKIK